MATRLKTIEYAVPTLATLADNTLTAMTTITAYIPEFSSTVTFKSVIFEMSVKEGATMTTGNYTSRRIDVSVGGAGATSYTNANLHTGSGENATVFYGCDATAHFATNWTTGTSKTIACSVLVDFTATTIAAVDVDMTFHITYEYDDACATQIKTVYLPLNAPTTLCGTTEVSRDTFPALDTELPETSKVFRNIHVVAQGNINQAASATDSTITLRLGSLTAKTSSSLEMGAASDYWTRFIYNVKYYDSAGTAAGISLNTSLTYAWYIYGSVSRFNHPQAFAVITYEFDATATTDCYNSVLLPADGVMMGGTTSSDFQRIATEFWIEEPATVTSKRIAFYPTWEQAAPIASLYMRVGTGSFVTYTDAATMVCGSNGAMCRNDSAFTLARGKNTINFDCYRTDTADFGLSLEGFWILTYTSAKPTGGYGAANHTVRWGTSQQYSGATATNVKTTALATTIPETNYFLNCYGAEVKQFPNSTGTYQGGALLMEKTSSAGQWYPALQSLGHTDAEQGLHLHYAYCDCIVYRWASDPDTNRLDPEGTRRWWWSYSAAQTGFSKLDIWFTYHTNTFTVAGTVSGYADADGAGLTVKYYRTTDGVYLGQSTTTTGGAHTFTTYDNTIPVFARVYEDNNHVGSSVDSVPV